MVRTMNGKAAGAAAVVALAIISMFASLPGADIHGQDATQILQEQDQNKVMKWTQVEPYSQDNRTMVVQLDARNAENGSVTLEAWTFDATGTELIGHHQLPLHVWSIEEAMQVIDPHAWEANHTQITLSDPATIDELFNEG